MAYDKFLSQDEVDELLKGVSGETDAPKASEPAAVDEGGVRPYNLATQERVIRGRLHTLEIINERFARSLRTALFKAARGVEWLYDAKHENPYEDMLLRRAEAEPSPEPAPVATPPPPPPRPPTPEQQPSPTPAFAAGVPAWPMPAELHPLVAGLPAEAETSVATVGRYIAEREPHAER